ncbi:magnesium transporter [Denitrobaculum tricleocarpae]|uniref:Magnesium transporter MgtE n=1 Tax=Denitrobaculum tricleocarpae TaxID=2591009 RepID=A0A545TL28_9PROT|nr:magnesium transporter [Denitrobaculum tricleocarpae]TQV77940.1 magnesium transporter [Denitrobaculum tricleocarpae]
MSEPQPARSAPDAPSSDTEESPGLSMELVFAVQDALAEERVTEIEDLVPGLHEADAADLLETLNRDERKLLVEILGSTFDPEILPNLDVSVREEVIEWLGPTGLARAVTELDSDDAVEVFEDLDEEFQHRILSQLPQAHRMILEEGLSYPEDSAGRLMQREFVVIPSAWTVGETIDYMRAAKDLPDDFYDLYIVNPKHHPIGFLPLSRVMRTKRHVRLTEFMETDLKTIPLTMDQEDVAYLFRQYGLVSAPVVDDAGRLLGVITVDDVVHIIDEEAGDDIMKMGGVSEPDLYSAVLDTTKARFTWLVVNLLTAILASLVISLFDATIEQIVALAVLMPIVASMGGNAGTQTLTVAVRSLAMKDLTEANATRFIGKELLIGTINGVLFAVLAGGVTWLWFESLSLGIVIAAAMVINMVVAGLSGTLIPLGLEKVGVDPAIASSVFLTTVTDVIGFFAFLGLAAAFLL